MNFATIVDRHAESSTALVSQGRVTTYGQLRRQVGVSFLGALQPGLARPGALQGIADVDGELAEALAFQLDFVAIHEGVEAAMRAAGADPDAYLASRKARAACDPYFCGQCAEEAYR